MGYGVYKRTSGGTGRMVTDDPNKLPPLPQGQGPWVFEKTAKSIKPGAKGIIGGEADEIIRQVQEKGFYEWPQPKDVPNPDDV